MSDGVNIPIKTTFDGKGTRDGIRSLDQLEIELKELRTEMKNVSVDSPDFAPMRDKANALGAEIKTLGESHEVAAKKGSNFGQAMLQGSRGIQDFSVAGIPGVVNNLEGLASALGATAGAAGGVTLVAVAIDLLMRNWGTLKGAFGSADEVKGMWAAMTPDETFAERLNDIATAQERLADSYQRNADTRKNDLDSQQAELDWMEKRKKLWEGIVPTPEEQGKLPPLPGTEKPSAELTKAAINQAKAEAQTKADLDKFKAADKAVKDQQGRVDAIAKIATFDERLKLGNSGDREELGRLMGRDSRGLMPADLQRMNELRENMQRRVASMRAEMPSVSGLTDGLTGDAEKDGTALQARASAERTELKRLEGERYKSAQQAEQSRQQERAAESEVKGRAQFEKDDAAQKIYREDGIAPAQGLFASADSQAGIPQAIEQQRNQIKQGQQQVEQALKSQGEAVVQSLNQMQTGLTGTLGAMVQTLSSLAARVSATESEVNTIRSNTVR